MKDLTQLSLGACIDELYAVRAKRLEIKATLDAMVSEEERIRSHLFETFEKDSLESASGAEATASITRTTVPTVRDWDAFTQYIKDNNAFDLLERRASTSGYRARMEQNEVVPGVEPFVKLNISLTRRSR